MHFLSRQKELSNWMREIVIYLYEPVKLFALQLPFWYLFSDFALFAAT